MRAILTIVTAAVLSVGCSAAIAEPEPTPDVLREIRLITDACASMTDVIKGVTEALQKPIDKQGESLARVKRSLERVTHRSLRDARVNMSLAIDYLIQVASYRNSGNRQMAGAAAGLAASQNDVAISHFKAACT